MIRLREARQLASHQGWLAEAPPAFRHAVLDRCSLKEFGAGETIYMAGDEPGGMYGLITGGLLVTITTGERGPNLAHYFRPVTWFGEGPGITGGPRLAGFAASRRSELLYLPLHAIDDILRLDPPSWRLFVALAMMKVEITLSAMNDLTFRQSRKRVIAVLLRLAGCRLATPPGEAAFEVDVSQHDLAALSNVSRATLSSVLKPLSEDGLIILTYRRIDILKPDKMRMLLA